MKKFLGKKYITFKEWWDSDPDRQMPDGLAYMSVGGPVPFPVSELFRVRFNDRYIAEPVDDETGEPAGFSHRFEIEAARIYHHFRPLITGIEKMLEDLYFDGEHETVYSDGETETIASDGEQETVENKRAPGGGTNFESAFSDGGTIRKKEGATVRTREGGTVRDRSGMNSGNIDRIIKAESELRDLYDSMMDQYEILFMSARFGWGCTYVYAD